MHPPNTVTLLTIIRVKYVWEIECFHEATNSKRLFFLLSYGIALVIVLFDVPDDSCEKWILSPH